MRAFEIKETMRRAGMKKMTVLFTAFCFAVSVCGCASVPSNKNLTRAEEKRVERDNGLNMWLGISSFGGLVIGGLAGIATGPQNGKVGAMVEGCLAGGLIGLLGSYVVIENIKNAEPMPNSSKADEQFQDYRNIEGK
jgi:hypothetical protein